MISIIMIALHSHLLIPFISTTLPLLLLTYRSLFCLLRFFADVLRCFGIVCQYTMLNVQYTSTVTMYDVIRTNMENGVDNASSRLVLSQAIISK